VGRGLAHEALTGQGGDVSDFDFIADRPVLDFVATVAERGTAGEEKLRRPRDLAVWAREAGIVDGPVKVTADQLAHARAVREALFGLITAAIDDRRPSRADRDLVNAAASGVAPTLNLTGAGTVARRGDIASVLAALAQDGLDLYDSADADSLRRCADPHCTRVFLDRSRGGRRRWCGMKGCGDRAKAASYRQRMRDSEAG
jgi:predicted RNA-binding Zn ribbon-like protein